jgi:excisionase family DNA binding protein
MNEEGPKLDYRDPEWVGDQLGIDKNTVYRYLQEGVLPGLQLGRKWLVSERRLAEFLERAEREQTERRRVANTGEARPFALPQKLRMLPTDDQPSQ